MARPLANMLALMERLHIWRYRRDNNTIDQWNLNVYVGSVTERAVATGEHGQNSAERRWHPSPDPGLFIGAVSQNMKLKCLLSRDESALSR